MLIKKVGTCLTKIRRWYKQAENYGDITEELQDEIQQHFAKYAPKTKFTKPKSMFHQNAILNPCSRWHVDVYEGMLISSYPHPTEIYIPIKRGIHFKSLSSCDNIANDQQINRLISQGFGKVFVPEPGDIYLLRGYPLHRRNPKAKNKAHICCRLWIDNKTDYNQQYNAYLTIKAGKLSPTHLDKGKGK